MIVLLVKQVHLQNEVGAVGRGVSRRGGGRGKGGVLAADVRGRRTERVVTRIRRGDLRIMVPDEKTVGWEQCR